jgi:hypothetical protein
MVECGIYDSVCVDGDWPSFPAVQNAFGAGSLTTNNYRLIVSHDDGVGIHYKGDHNRFSKVCVSTCGAGSPYSNHGFYSNPNTGEEPVGTEITECLIVNNNGDGINNTRSNVSSATNQVVSLCHIIGNAQDGIQAAGGLTVLSSYLNGTGTVEGEHGDGWQAATGGHVTACNNVFEAWPQTIFIESGGEDADMSDILIYNNCFFYSGSFGYMAGVLLSSKYTTNDVVVGWTNLLVANNTFFCLTNRNQVKLGINNTGAYTNCSSLAVGCKVVNNIFWYADPSMLPINIEDIDTTETDFLIQTNIICGNAAVTWDGTAYASVAELVAAHPLFSGNTESEPTWFGSPPTNLRLAYGSVGVNAAANLSLEFTTDITGKTRTGDWDIGAYEYGRLLRTTTLRAGNVTGP